MAFIDWLPKESGLNMLLSPFQEGDDAPPFPSAGELNRQVIQSQIQSLPDILGAYRDYAPQFTDIARNIRQQAAPEGFALEQALGQNLMGQGFGTDITPSERTALLQNVRGGQRLRGTFTSGSAPIEEAISLYNLGENKRQRNIQNTLGFLGRTPTAAGDISGVPVESLGGTQLANAILAPQQFAQQQYLGQQQNRANTMGSLGQLASILAMAFI